MKKGVLWSFQQPPTKQECCTVKKTPTKWTHARWRNRNVVGHGCPAQSYQNNQKKPNRTRDRILLLGSLYCHRRSGAHLWEGPAFFPLPFRFLRLEDPSAAGARSSSPSPVKANDTACVVRDAFERSEGNKCRWIMNSLVTEVGSCWCHQTVQFSGGGTKM